VIARRAAIALLACVLAPACRCTSSSNVNGGDATARADLDTSSGDASPNPAALAALGGPIDWKDTLVRAHVPALAVAVVQDGRIVREGAWGLADVARNVPARSDTAFEAASIGKTVIAIAVMKLVENKTLTLDADVSAHLPFAVHNPKHPNAPITLRMLLTHTGSIHDRVDVLEAAVSPAGAPGMVPGKAPPRSDDALRDFLRGYLVPGGASYDPAKSFLAEPPGRKMEYSNVGAALAALVVERVTKEPFDAWSKREVLAAVGATGAVWDSAAIDPARRATPHRWDGAAHVALPAASHAVYPVVDLHATARELAGLLVLAMGPASTTPSGATVSPTVLSRASVDAMLAPQPPIAPDQALGWQLVSVGSGSGERRLVGHEGEDRGASTLMFFDPRARIGAVILANGDAFASGDGARAAAMQHLLLSLLDGAW
jgi:CubicO group peptidase (beta-lactamase class C family)